jgi:hypothetical protein
MVYSISMRFCLISLLGLTLSGCASTASTTGEMKVESGVLRATGIIVEREIFDLKRIDKNTETAADNENTFGLEYLTEASSSGYRSSTAIRYDIEVLGGGFLTVYSEAWRYRKDDCVSVIIDLEDKTTPPVIFLNNNDC